MNRSICWAAAMAAPFILGCGAQSSASTWQEADSHAGPSFEVATIKPSKPDNYKPVGLYIYPGGRIYASQCTFKMLVQYAFGLQDFQVEGGPGWADSDLFDVTALPSNSSDSRGSEPKFINEPPNDQQRQMLQSLLVERFGFKFHRIAKQNQVFFLVRGRKPLALDTAKLKDSLPVLVVGGYGNGGMSGQNVTMAFMAKRLTTCLEHPVLDQTGIFGAFDFKLDPSSGGSREESSDEYVNGIFESIARLGLKLKPGRGPVDTIVIESVARPIEN